MTTPDLTPRAPRHDDAAALIGLLAKIEGQLMVEGRDGVPSWAQPFAARLAQDGFLERPGDVRALRQCLNDLNHRLRYVLGEYDEPPVPVPVP